MLTRSQLYYRMEKADKNPSLKNMMYSLVDAEIFQRGDDAYHKEPPNMTDYYPRFLLLKSRHLNILKLEAYKMFRRGEWPSSVAMKRAKVKLADEDRRFFLGRAVAGTPYYPRFGM